MPRRPEQIEVACVVYGAPALLIAGMAALLEVAVLWDMAARAEAHDGHGCAVGCSDGALGSSRLSPETRGKRALVRGKKEGALRRIFVARRWGRRGPWQAGGGLPWRACVPRLCQEAEVEDARAPGGLGRLLPRVGQVGREVGGGG